MPPINYGDERRARTVVIINTNYSPSHSRSHPVHRISLLDSGQTIDFVTQPRSLFRTTFDQWPMMDP